jgi:type II secretory pathway pseudopilin PulG
MWLLIVTTVVAGLAVFGLGIVSARINRNQQRARARERAATEEQRVAEAILARNRPNLQVGDDGSSAMAMAGSANANVLKPSSQH